MYARFEGRVAQEFELQARRSELWRCRDSGTQAGIRWPGRRKFVVGEKPPIADADAATPPRDQIREQKKDEKVRGWEGVTPAVPLTRVVFVRSVPCCSPRRPPAPRPPVAEVAAFESCMLTMCMERGVGLRPPEKGTGVCC